MNQIQRYERQDPWPDVQFDGEGESIADAMVCAVCTIVFFGWLFSVFGG